jgi:hypothetical protein
MPLQRIETDVSKTEIELNWRLILSEFSNIVVFYHEELLAHHTTSKLENHSMSTVLCLLFKIFIATLHIWRPSLQPQPEDMLCVITRSPPNIDTELITAIKLNKKLLKSFVF